MMDAKTQHFIDDFLRDANITSTYMPHVVLQLVRLAETIALHNEVALLYVLITMRRLAKSGSGYDDVYVYMNERYDIEPEN